MLLFLNIENVYLVLRNQTTFAVGDKFGLPRNDNRLACANSEVPFNRFWHLRILIKVIAGCCIFIKSLKLLNNMFF